jgi:hypothetical protein
MKIKLIECPIDKMEDIINEFISDKKIINISYKAKGQFSTIQTVLIIFE